MPCIFCIAAGIMIAAALSSTAVEEIEETLKKELDNVEQCVDTESVSMWKASAQVRQGGMQKKIQHVPVAIHIYKKHDRARIQILTHDISQTDAESIEDRISTTLGATIVSRQYMDEKITHTPNLKKNRKENTSPDTRRKNKEKRSSRGINQN